MSNNILSFMLGLLIGELLIAVFFNILKKDNENLKEEKEWLRNAVTYWRERNQAKDKIIENLEKEIQELKKRCDLNG